MTAMRLNHIFSLRSSSSVALMNASSGIACRRLIASRRTSASSPRSFARRISLPCLMMYDALSRSAAGTGWLRAA